MLKLAISGKAGSGKNSVANIIIKDILHLYQDEFHIAAFATPIKKMIQEMFPNCDQKSLYGNSELRQNKITSALDEYANNSIITSHRQAAIDIGKLGRFYHPNFWVWHAKRTFDSIMSENLFYNTSIKAYIIADLRFPNEFEWLKQEEFFICRIKRYNNAKINDISEYIQDELSDNMFDFVIDNNGTMDNLKQQIYQMMEKINK
jgi:hypothetical protein